MFTIKKTGEGYYLVSLAAPIKEMRRNECHLLRKEIMPILKPHREISVNIHGVKTIYKGGFTILEELKSVADRYRCNIRFINVDPGLASKIASLTAKKVQPQEEPDY
jgi:hypothetical protein